MLKMCRLFKNKFSSLFHTHPPNHYIRL